MFDSQEALLLSREIQNRFLATAERDQLARMAQEGYVTGHSIRADLADALRSLAARVDNRSEESEEREPVLAGGR